MIVASEKELSMFGDQFDDPFYCRCFPWKDGRMFRLVTRHESHMIRWKIMEIVQIVMLSVILTCS